MIANNDLHCYGTVKELTTGAAVRVVGVVRSPTSNPAARFQKVAEWYLSPCLIS